jgi:Dolichyl-phosphate-mannose-protein mannosyltransferase
MISKDTASELRTHSKPKESASLGFRLLPRPIDPALVLILILPLVLLLLSNRWILAPIGYVDSWLYTAYLRELPELLQTSPNLYYGTRLSWLLPGYAVYRIFPPILANSVLHLGVYYAATFSLYLTLKLIFNRAAALLAVLLMGTYSYFLGAVGTDYSDGAGLAYFSLTLLFLTLSSRSARWLWWLFLAGLMCAGFLYTNIVWIILTPLVPIYYLVSNSRHRRNSIMASAVAFSAGLVALTVVLGLANYLMNGNFLFFGPSLTLAGSIYATGQPRPLPLQSWISEASWWSLPIAVFVSSLLFLRRKDVRHEARQNYSIVMFPLLFMIAFLIFLLAYFVGNVAAIMRASYYVSYLLPLQFLSLGTQFFLYAKFDGNRQFWMIAIAGTAILVIPFAFSNAIAPLFPFWQIFSIFPAFVFYMIGLVFVARKPVLVGKLIFFFVTFSVANLTIYPQNSIPFTTLATDSSYRAVVESFDAMQAIESLSQLRVWYQYDEPLSRIFVSAAAWPLIADINASHASDNFPALASARIGFNASLSRGTKIAIISATEGTFEQARLTLEGEGLSARLLSEKNIDHGPIHFTITFIEVVAYQATF